MQKKFNSTDRLSNIKLPIESEFHRKNFHKNGVYTLTFFGTLLALRRPLKKVFGNTFWSLEMQFRAIFEKPDSLMPLLLLRRSVSPENSI